MIAHAHNSTIAPAARLAGLTANAASGGWRRRVAMSVEGGAGDYDATASKGRRQPPRSDTRAEHLILNSARRKRLIGTGRDAIRNQVLIGWMIRRHIDYVAQFNFQARTGIDDLDRQLEAFVWLDGLRRNFEVSGRFSRAAAMRMIEARKVIDGDMFAVKLTGGAVQLVEGDRVRGGLSESVAIPPASGWTPADFVQGVSVGNGGRLQAVCVCKRTAGGGYTFERIIPARNLWQLACWETTYRIDQVRGIAPLAAALNTAADVYEGLDLALAKAKVAQMFGLIFYRQAVEEKEGFAGSRYVETDTEETTDVDGDGVDDITGEEIPDTDRYEVDPGQGPFKLELRENDRAEFLSTNTPETELLDAMKFCIDLTLKSLDIPHSFFDPSTANYYNRKADLQQYETSADAKREANIEFLDEHTAWRLGQRIIDGSLVLPAGMTLADVEWEWVAGGMPWVDKLRDIKADQLSLASNLDSEIRLARRRGQDAHDIAVERLDYLVWLNKEREQRGLPPLADLPGGALAGGSKNTTDNTADKADDNA